MKKISADMIIYAMEHDFNYVLNQDTSLREIKDIETFVELFINSWIKYAKKEYIWYPQIIYTLSHSYKTIFLIGEKIEEWFYNLNKENENKVIPIKKQLENI